ncbi:hypothetical protein L596_026551 [Steinernema carpocapsae]|uniref:DOMON domain-containing protein n=1 Tax=Steinernema carpocapsae TaxID=34508 RepID=A0A4U5M1Q6_STECR|nr:hypothetical protein L596_026551 [Steinernema carpocapsae]
MLIFFTLVFLTLLTRSSSQGCQSVTTYWYDHENVKNSFQYDLSWSSGLEYTNLQSTDQNRVIKIAASGPGSSAQSDLSVGGTAAIHMSDMKQITETSRLFKVIRRFDGNELKPTFPNCGQIAVQLLNAMMVMSALAIVGARKLVLCLVFE